MDLICEYQKNAQLRIAKYLINEDIKNLPETRAPAVDDRILRSSIYAPEGEPFRIPNAGATTIRRTVTAASIEDIPAPFTGRPVIRGGSYVPMNENNLIPALNLPTMVMGPLGEPVELRPIEFSPIDGVIHLSPAPAEIPRVQFIDDVWFNIRLENGQVIRARNFTVERDETQEDEGDP